MNYFLTFLHAPSEATKAANLTAMQAGNDATVYTIN